MSKKKTTSADPGLSPEQTKVQLTINKIQAILDEDGMQLQALFDGYPLQLRPIVRVIPKPENVETKEQAA